MLISLSKGDRPRKAGALLAAFAFVATISAASGTAVSKGPNKNEYRDVPKPQGFGIANSELDGPVFVDDRGRTLYQWPSDTLRNGLAGDEKGKVTCTDDVATETAGLMSIYPPGLTLPSPPDAYSCAQMWPPAIAAPNSKAIGDWSLIDRSDGKQQWAYKEYALYTSFLDVQPGDVFGPGPSGPFVGPPRRPIGPPPNLPPGFIILTTQQGRMLVNSDRRSLYVFTKDTEKTSYCDLECQREWSPVLAPSFSQKVGDWSTLTRADGSLQWVYRGKPLYLRPSDLSEASVDGSDVPGWSNVYVQAAPPLPEDFTLQDTSVGQVIADAYGRTIYQYNCVDDSAYQLVCDHPKTPQNYRLAICGAGDPERCAVTWPYVLASGRSKSISRTWRVVEIDPRTGRPAAPKQENSIRVWAYRDRPLYLFSGDKVPGDIYGDAWGENVGRRNGFTAIVVRNAFGNR